MSDINKKMTAYRKNPFKIYEFLFDDDIPMNERMFIIAMSMSAFSSLYMSISGYFAGTCDLFTSIYLVIAGVIMLGFLKLGISFNIVDLCTKIFITLVIFVLFPMLYFTSGGNEGGIVAWNLLGGAYILVLLNGKTKIRFFITELLIVSSTYAISYFFPESVTRFNSRNDAMLDSFSSYLLVALFIAVLILYQNTLLKRERDKANEQYKEIEKLNIAQNNFFSNMSHEIRTPINTIIGLNEMTLREENVSDEAIENAISIESASKMLLSLINDILDMSKMQSGNMDILPVQYDTKTLFSDVVNMIYIQSKNKDLNFKIIIDPEFPSVLLCDEVRLRQILINLLNNAVKYTNEGSITLQVRCEKLQDKKILTTYSISDTGIGIRKENIPYLFDSFKRVDQNKNRFIEGTGLGLSICRQLAELMNGKISVDSVYTKGSTFHFSVEQIIIDETAIGNVDFVVNQVKLGQKKYHQSFEAPSARILVVDDNELNRTVAAKLLRDTRVMIDLASDGQTALELARTNYYNIILMDHMMPVMDGIECTYQIRNQIGGLNNDTPIIALTANARSDSNEFYSNAGFDGYLSKPVSGASLEAAIIKYLPGDLITYIDLKSESVISSTIDSEKVYKKRTAVSTNSTCDLNQELLEMYNISIIPYTVKTDRGKYLDVKEIDAEQLEEYIDRTGKSVNIVAPSVEEYEDYFSNLLNNYDEIIHICSLKDISPDGLDNAYKAAAAFGSIHIIDSRQFSGGLGLIAMFTSMLLNQGVPTDDAINIVSNYVKMTESHAMICDNKSFFMKDVVATPVLKLSNSLMLKPVLASRNGRFEIKTKYFGNYNVCVNHLIKDLMHNNQNIDDRFLLLTYSSLSVDHIEAIKTEIKKYINFEHVNALKCSAINFGLLGKDSIGIFYFNKE